MPKAAFHVHSDWSYDGKWSLERIAKVFSERGYDVVFLCEHCRTFDADRWCDYQEACSVVSEGAKLVPGIEYSDPDNIVHVPVWGCPIFIGSERPTKELIRGIEHHEKAFSVLAHPVRRNAWSRVSKDLLDAVDGIEIWNRKTDGFAPSSLADEIVETGKRLLASLDFHHDRQRFPMHVDIDCPPDASCESIIAAMKSGDYQSFVFNRSCELSISGLRRACFRTLERSRKLLGRSMVVRSALNRGTSA